MTYLGIDEMDVVLSEMSEQEVHDLMDNLQTGYKNKKVSLGHALTDEQETRIRDDLLSDNLLYMKALQELKNRYQRLASEAWRKFDDEAEEYIRKLKQNLSDGYRNKGLDNLLGYDHD